jgi:hypothetical protein
MKVLLDECVPVQVKNALPAHKYVVFDGTQ